MSCGAIGRFAIAQVAGLTPPVFSLSSHLDQSEDRTACFESDETNSPKSILYVHDGAVSNSAMISPAWVGLIIAPLPLARVESCPARWGNPNSNSNSNLKFKFKFKFRFFGAVSCLLAGLDAQWDRYYHSTVLHKNYCSTVPSATIVLLLLLLLLPPPPSWTLQGEVLFGLVGVHGNYVVVW